MYLSNELWPVSNTLLVSAHKQQLKKTEDWKRLKDWRFAGLWVQSVQSLGDWHPCSKAHQYDFRTLQQPSTAFMSGLWAWHLLLPKYWLENEKQEVLGCCNVGESYWCALEQGCLLNPRRGYNQCGLLGYQGPARPAFQFYIKYRYCGCGSGCELCVYFVYAAEWMRAICKAGGAQKLSKPVDQARQNMSTGKTCFFNDYTTVLIGYYDYHPVTKSAKNRVLWLFPNVLLVLKNYLPVTIIGRVPR